MTLYDLTQTWTDFAAAIEAGEIPEEAIKDTLEAIEGDITAKVDNMACLIKHISAESEAIATEIKSLTERKQAKDNAVKRIKHYILTSMQATGTPKIETARNIVRLQNNPEKIVISDEADFVRWAAIHNDSLLTYKTPAPNKKAIKDFLDSGSQLDGVSIVQEQGVRIK